MQLELNAEQQDMMLSEFIEFVKTENGLCSKFNKFLKSEYQFLGFIGLGKTWFVSMGNDEFEFAVEQESGVPEQYEKYISRNCFRFVAIDSSTFTVKNINGFTVNKNKLQSVPEIIKTFDDIKDIPSLGDNNFSILYNAFTDYFSHKSNSASEYFNDEKNTPEHSIIKVSETFNDVDSDGKYGTIQYHIYYHSELIGIGSVHGRWLSTHSFYTFNKKKWIEMLTWLDSQIPDEEDEWDSFIKVIDPNCENMLDWVSIEGITRKDYSNE